MAKTTLDDSNWDNGFVTYSNLKEANKELNCKGWTIQDYKDHTQIIEKDNGVLIIENF